MTIPPRLSAPIEDYTSYWQKLGPRSIRLIEKIADPSLRYTGPFFDTHGTDAFEQMATQLFSKIEKTKINITDTAVGQDEQTVYMRWIATVITKGKKRQWTFQGVSEVAFSPTGKVMSHIDHWDSGLQFYLRLPVAGWIIRKILGRMFKG